MVPDLSSFLSIVSMANGLDSVSTVQAIRHIKDKVRGCELAPCPLDTAKGRATVAPSGESALDFSRYKWYTNSMNMQITEIVDAIADEAGNIEFEDSSSLVYENDGWVTLPEMEDPVRARNNCFGATHAIDEFIVTRIGVDADSSAHVVGTVFTDGKAHWANMICMPEADMVIDYTARQFDESVAVPLVLPVYEWAKWVSARVEQRYGAKLDNMIVH